MLFPLYVERAGAVGRPKVIEMMRRLGLFLSVAFLSSAFVSAGCDNHDTLTRPEAGVNDTGPGVDGGMAFPDTGIGFSELQILRLVPDHGPFIGGNVSILRGAGFTAEAQVTFGTHQVQGADHTLIDTRRLQVVVPAGDVGVVDVTIQAGDHTFTLAHGYTYDALSVDPNRGSVAGGTFVNIVGSGTAFATGDTVLFGRTPCTDVIVVSPERITCHAPQTSAGTVDVTVVSGADGSEDTAVQAYSYYDSSDPVSGGLGGGPANGTINVTAIDFSTGMPILGAFAIVGEDLATPYQGFTDSMGQISFSGPDLVGQHSVHISKHCYTRTSFIAFDAQDATAFMIPWTDPMCGMGMAGGGGRGRNGSFVSGDLVFPGANEYGPNPWDIIPHPRDGWVRVAYVYATQTDIGQPNPDPSLGGAIQRVVETNMPPEGHLGYPYSIFVTPRGMAVFALAGLENPATQQFIPYVMGVARNVLVGPGETATGVNVPMTLPLDHSLVADLGMVPPQVRSQPDRFFLQAYVDLGGEGVIVRTMPGHIDPSTLHYYDFDSIHRRDATREFRFVAEPPLEGALSDGRFRVIAGYNTLYQSPYTGNALALDFYPFTYVLQSGITAVDEHVQMQDFLGIPDAISPADGEHVPADRMLRWNEVGPPADFHIILMFGGDGNPAWLMFVRGDQHAAAIPDLSSIPMIEDISDGRIQWGIYSVTIPGFDFDTLTYNYLSMQYWSSYSYNYFTSEI